MGGTRPEQVAVLQLRRNPVMRLCLYTAVVAAILASIQCLEHLEVGRTIMFELVCTLGAEGIVSKRKASRYVSGRCDAWRKVKNPAAPAVRREAEEDRGMRR